MVSVSVPSNDDFFEQIVDWMDEKHVLRTTDLLVKSNPDGKVSARTPGYDFDDDYVRVVHGDRDSLSLTYSPDMGTYYFLHRARLFRFTRRVDRDFNEYSTRKKLQGQVITMSCVAWTAAPIKNLFREIQTWKAQNEKNETIIRHPSLGYRGNRSWSRLMTRPSRPMETVVMDENDKIRILEHVREYLRKDTVKWYADRGIPYRLGLLFWGPSGTGKTSFATALAGYFKLDIYFIALGSGDITETDLVKMLVDLPQRCLVLIEDVDSAGIQREGVGRKKKRGEADVSDSSDSADTKRKATNKISLSGLLNAIDGVAAQEGRILIMTTNYRGRIDEALLRPGRVDEQIKFGLASTTQIRELFKRMYTGFDPEVPLGSEPKPIQPSSQTRLEQMADEFAQKVPADQYSPAEVQGFLLRIKKEPHRALDEVDGWIASKREDKQE